MLSSTRVIVIASAAFVAGSLLFAADPPVAKEAPKPVRPSGATATEAPATDAPATDIPSTAAPSPVIPYTESPSSPAPAGMAQPTRPVRRGYPFLGVYVTPVHPRLAEQLRDVLPSGQGLFIEYVEQGSAADRAGIHRRDILASYDDHKLVSAEQLIRLVNADEVGDEAIIGYVRNGKLEKTRARLENMEAVFPDPPRTRIKPVRPLTPYDKP